MFKLYLPKNVIEYRDIKNIYYKIPITQDLKIFFDSNYYILKSLKQKLKFLSINNVRHQFSEDDIGIDKLIACQKYLNKLMKNNLTIHTDELGVKIIGKIIFSHLPILEFEYYVPPGWVVFDDNFIYLMSNCNHFYEIIIEN